MPSVQDKLKGKKTKNYAKLTSGHDVDPSLAKEIINEASLEPKRLLFETLSVSPDNKYSVNQEEVQELADSIMSIGMLDYPVVEMKSPVEYQILSGQKRFLAVSLLRKKYPDNYSVLFPGDKIPCRVVDFDTFKVYGKGDMGSLSTSAKRMWVIAAGNQQHEKTPKDYILQVEQLSYVYKELKSEGLITTGERQREFISKNMDLQARSVQRVLSAKRLMSRRLWDAVRNYDGLTSIRMLEGLANLPLPTQAGLAMDLEAGKKPDLTIYLQEESLGENEVAEVAATDESKTKHVARTFQGTIPASQINQERLGAMFLSDSLENAISLFNSSKTVSDEDARKLEEISYRMEKLRRKTENILKRYR